MDNERLTRLKKAHAILKPFVTEINLDNIAQAVNDAGTYGRCVYDTLKYFMKSGLICLEERITSEEKAQAGASVLKKTLKIGKIYEIRQTEPKKYPKEERGRVAVIQIRSFGKKSIGIYILAKNHARYGEVYKTSKYDPPTRHLANLISFGDNKRGGYHYYQDGTDDLVFKEIQPKDLPFYMTMQTTEHFEKVLKGG